MKCLYMTAYLSGAGSSLKDQISSILHQGGKEIILKHPYLQLQSDSCDCEFFSLAFATSLVNVIKPETQVFIQVTTFTQMFSREKT